MKRAIATVTLCEPVLSIELILISCQIAKTIEDFSEKTVLAKQENVLIMQSPGLPIKPSMLRLKLVKCQSLTLLKSR